MRDNIFRGRRDAIAALTALAMVPRAATVRAQDNAFSPQTDRLIVKLRNRPVALASVLFDDAILSRLSAQAGVTLVSLRALGDGSQVLRMQRPMPESEAQAIATRLEGLAEVEHAVPDRVMRTQ